MARVRKKDAPKGEEDFENSILARLTREQQQTSLEDQSGEVTLFFCGPKKSGKTSLVDRFINPAKVDDNSAQPPKPTVALDYKFARYAPSDSSGSSGKMLAHIYDLGGEDCNDSLVAMPVSAATVGHLVAAIVVDLSEPWTVLPALDKWMTLLRAQAAKAFEAMAQDPENGPQRVAAIQAARQAAVEAAYSEHPDAGSITPFPVQLVIFGSKWDVLAADHDREKIKGLCRALRYIAHVNAASLAFSALKDRAAMKSVAGLLKQVVFGATTKGGLSEQLDPGKAIFVMPGNDSLNGIGAPHGNHATEKAWRDTVADLFPDPTKLSKEVKKSDAAQVAEDLPNFPESSIDGMVEQRNDELKKYRAQVERNQRLASEGITSKEGVLAG